MTSWHVGIAAEAFAAAGGTIDCIPDEWKFTAKRAKYMFETYGK